MSNKSLGKRKADTDGWIEYAEQPPAAYGNDQERTNTSNLVSDAVASSAYRASPVVLPPLPRAPTATGTAKGRHPSKKIHPIPPPGSRVLDKSCARCRIRKVKCDRIYPICANCTDRKETCNLVELAKLAPKHKVTTFKPAGLNDEPEDVRIAILERRLASLEHHGGAQSTTTGSYYSPMDNPAASTSSLQPWSSLENQQSSIGPASLDWRLGKPTMAHSLSQHLCEAFFDSCCSHLPAFAFFTDNPPDFRGDPANLTESDKVAIAVFCSIGARASPHSALLGIAPQDARSPSHLLNAGTRRESACSVLRLSAHESAFTSSLNDSATILNLAAVLALMQMSVFHELVPRKSRSLIRVALGHFKDLQDDAAGERERLALRRSFALSLYAGDAITSAYAQKQPLITESDLRKYFDHVGIVIPRYPGEDLISILDSLLGERVDHSGDGTNGSGRDGGGAGGGVEGGMRTATHLLSCHLYSAQRRWATISSPPQKSTEEILKEIPILYSIIDIARSGITHAQSFLQPSSSHSHSHSPSSYGQSNSPSSYGQSNSPYDRPTANPSYEGSTSTAHSHATDYGTMLIRTDRDLLDLGSMIHVFLESRFSLGGRGLDEGLGRGTGGGGVGLNRDRGIGGGVGAEGCEGEGEMLWRRSCSRVRRGFECLAYYAKVYLNGIDRHLIFHFAFQLELNPHWTTMVLQRFGEVDGPTCKEEEVSEVELGWLIKGMEAACYYTPSAERRLAELTSRFSVVPPPILNPIPSLSPVVSLIPHSHPPPPPTTYDLSMPLHPTYDPHPNSTTTRFDPSRSPTMGTTTTTYQTNYNSTYSPYQSHSRSTRNYQDSTYTTYDTSYNVDVDVGVGVGNEVGEEIEGEYELEGYVLDPSEGGGGGGYYVPQPPQQQQCSDQYVQLLPPTTSTNYPQFSHSPGDYSTNGGASIDYSTNGVASGNGNYRGGNLPLLYGGRVKSEELVDDWRGLY